MSKMTKTELETVAAKYVDATKQAGAWQSTTDNIYGAVDKIGKMVMLDGGFEDHLPELDGEELPLGKTIEEYFIDLVLPESYSDMATEGAKDGTPSLPSVEECSYSYTLGREKIKTTVPYDNVERAALTSTDASNMVSRILERLGSSYSMFKYAAKKQLLGNAADKAITANQSITVAVPSDTETAEKFILEIKKAVEDAKFAAEGGLNNTLIGSAPSLILYVKKGVIPQIQVNALAGAINKAELTFDCQVKVIDDFGTLTDNAKNVYAMLVDPRGIKLHRTYHAIRSKENADGDYINYVDHSEHTGFISKNTFIKAIKSE